MEGKSNITNRIHESNDDKTIKFIKEIENQGKMIQRQCELTGQLQVIVSCYQIGGRKHKSHIKKKKWGHSIHQKYHN